MISLLGTFLLVHGFSALLPPIPDDKLDYYKVLNVSSNASNDDIRKAYRKISLQLHPDKVTQRGGNVEQAREQYQQVQEAYAVLSNPSKRRRYNVLQKSPTRYQFVSTGMTPGAMYDNLRKATIWDKSRLVFLALLLCCTILLQPILICAKINQDLQENGVLYETNWTVVLIPWWIFCGLLIVTQFVVLSLTKQVLFLVALFEHLAWLVGQVLLALQWDRTIAWDYKLVFIPIYLALALRWTHKILRLRQIQDALLRMVTLEYIERHVLQDGRQYQDLTEEEIRDIAQKYVVVHVPPMARHLQDEEDKVQASPEYEKAVETYTEVMNALIGGIFVSVPFVALVVAKVDGAIMTSWWIVFVPIWISLGWQVLGNTYACCCMPTVGAEVIGGGGNLDSDGESKQEENDGFEDRKADPSFDSVEGSIRHASRQSPTRDADGETSTASADGFSSNVTSNKTEYSVKLDNADAKESVKVALNSKEETKEPDVVEEIPTTPGNDEWSGIHIDDDMFHEFESAYQEAEESAMEAQAKSQANCCSAIFQLMMLCLLVGKLQRDYMRGENEKPGYNAFWILFPVFLVFGCVMCTCACLIYGAGESEGFDHLVERATHKEGQDEENTAAEVPVPQEDEGDDASPTLTATPTKETKEEAEETKEQPGATTEQQSDMHDLD